MATYVVQSDTYAGWSAGRSFGAVGLVAGALALLAREVLHGWLSRLRPAEASDQLFLAGLMWFGAGVFALMAFVVFKSIVLSARSRGTVTLDEEGVMRQIGRWNRRLRWNEIEGFVPDSYSGITLLPREGNLRIEIPRTLDDYRGLLDELRERHVTSLPLARLRRGVKWWERMVQFSSVYLLLLSFQAKLSHPRRIEAFCLGTVLFAGTIVREQRHEATWLRWLYAALSVLVLAWSLHHLTRNW